MANVWHALKGVMNVSQSMTVMFANLASYFKMEQLVCRTVQWDTTVISQTAVNVMPAAKNVVDLMPRVALYALQEKF
jgi:hypothetical protein